MKRNDVLESLVVSSTRLVRLAAQTTGSRTPSAVWRTLGILETDGPMRVGELAVASRVTQPGMTRVLATMVEEELVSLDEEGVFRHRAGLGGGGKGGEQGQSGEGERGGEEGWRHKDVEKCDRVTVVHLRECFNRRTCLPSKQIFAVRMRLRG